MDIRAAEISAILKDQIKRGTSFNEAFLTANQGANVRSPFDMPGRQN